MSKSPRNLTTLDHPPPPESWAPARTTAERLLSPVERFLSIEASSGIVLLAAAVLALIWANSPWRSSYEALLHAEIGWRIGGFSFRHDLHFWISDGLMVIFFFVVGLEIRSELHNGELRDVRRAALPVIAALGGMVVPAGVYLLFNSGTREAVSGWGIPMATDIAFAVGVLALLGKRVPPTMRLLLLALAVIDDVGAILVIAVFYSTGLSVGGLGVGAAGVLLIVLMQKIGFRSPWAYVPPAVVVWAGAYTAGIHPTIAGVVVGMLTPVRAWFGPARFVAHAGAVVDAIKAEDHARMNGSHLHDHLSDLDLARKEAVSPVERLRHALHGWVAFGIMPIFAFANAGVALGHVNLAVPGGKTVLVGILLGLVLGKPVGLIGFSWLAVRLRAAALPAGVSWTGMSIVGLVAGIGFTMALFIGSLAFPPGPLIEAGKVGVVAASVLAAAMGLTAGRIVLSPAGVHDGAASLPEAHNERSQGRGPEELSS